MFSYFQNKYLDQSSPLSEITQFRLFIKDEMEHRLTEFPGLGYEGEEGDMAQVKIAMITFAYSNSNVISKLMKRGTYIKNEDYKNLNKINTAFVEQLAHDNDFLDHMQRPCSVFLTCESEEGFNRALNYNDNIKLKDFEHFSTFLGQDIQIKEASEPTDILWENRMYTPFQRFYKKCIVFLIIFAMLYFSFQTIFRLQKKSLSMKDRYPPHPCDDFIEQYQGRRNAWMVDAIHEYQINNKALETTNEVFFTGPMQCFCKSEKADGHSSSEVYSSTDVKTGETFSEPICRNFFIDMLIAKIFGQSISFIVIAINVILKYTIMYLVLWIGEETASQQKATVTRGVFLA